MTQDITLQCSVIETDAVYASPDSRGLLLQVSQSGTWSQVLLTRSDALRLAEYIIMHVPREQTNVH